MLCPTLSTYWVKLGFISDYREFLNCLVFLRSADVCYTSRELLRQDILDDGLMHRRRCLDIWMVMDWATGVGSVRI